MTNPGGVVWCKHQKTWLSEYWISVIKRKVSWVAVVSGLVVLVHAMILWMDGMDIVTWPIIMFCFALYIRQAHNSNKGKSFGKSGGLKNWNNLGNWVFFYLCSGKLKLDVFSGWVRERIFYLEKGSFSIIALFKVYTKRGRVQFTWWNCLDFPMILGRNFVNVLTHDQSGKGKEKKFLHF